MNPRSLVTEHFHRGPREELSRVQGEKGSIGVI